MNTLLGYAIGLLVVIAGLFVGFSILRWGYDNDIPGLRWIGEFV